MKLQVCILPAKVLVDGTHKVRISIAHNGTTRYYVTRFVVPDKKNVKNGVVTGVGNASYINQQLRNIMTKMSAAYDEIEDAEYYTCSQLLEIIEAKMHRNSIVTFSSLADEWKKLKINQCTASSMKLYDLSISQFIEFAGENFILSTLTVTKVYEFDKFLANRGQNGTTINMRMNCLKAIVNFATEHKYIKYDIAPFKGYKAHPQKYRDIALDIVAFRRLRDIELTGYACTARDIFLLSFYLCGMNEADLVRLSFDSEILEFQRQKTKNRIPVDRVTSFTIQPETRVLLNKFLKNNRIVVNNSSELKKLHEFVKNHLRKAFDAAGISLDHKFYSARKSFAQYAEELGVQERIIAYCLGDTPPMASNGSVIGYYVKVNRKIDRKSVV